MEAISRSLAEMRMSRGHLWWSIDHDGGVVLLLTVMRVND